MELCGKESVSGVSPLGFCLWLTTPRPFTDGSRALIVPWPVRSFGYLTIHLFYHGQKRSRHNVNRVKRKKKKGIRLTCRISLLRLRHFFFIIDESKCNRSGSQRCLFGGARVEERESDIPRHPQGFGAGKGDGSGFYRARTEEVGGPDPFLSLSPSSRPYSFPSVLPPSFPLMPPPSLDSAFSSPGGPPSLRRGRRVLQPRVSLHIH